MPTLLVVLCRNFDWITILINLNVGSQADVAFFYVNLGWLRYNNFHHVALNDVCIISTCIQIAYYKCSESNLPDVLNKIIL